MTGFTHVTCLGLFTVLIPPLLSIPEPAEGWGQIEEGCCLGLGSKVLLYQGFVGILCGH